MENILLGIVALSFALLVALLLRLRTSNNRLKQLERDHEELNTLIDETYKINAQHQNPKMTDLLTGLPTRGVFEDRITQTINQAQRSHKSFVVMLLDIDNPETVKTLNSALKDRFIREFSNRLQATIRQVDTLTRASDQQYLFLLPIISRPETAIYIAQRIQDALLEAFSLDEQHFKINASIGISAYPLDGDSTQELIESANQAMLQARKSGPNKFQFYQAELNLLGEREKKLAHLFRSKDLLDRLRLKCQVYFNMSDKKPFYIHLKPHITSEDYGEICIKSVMEIFDNSGKVYEVNEWALTKGIEKIKFWGTIGFKASHLALSITLRQLENSRLIYKLIEIQKELAALSIQLVLEIIDDKFPKNQKALDCLFELLSANGIKFSINVMTFGHFAIQKVNNIPLRYLTIDTEMVRSATQNNNKENILCNIIELARDEEIIVLAEGIENEQHRECLDRIGCKIMEGRLFKEFHPEADSIE